jgi:hypothetical protein
VAPTRDRARRFAVRSSRLVFVALPANNEVRLPILETMINGVSIVTLIVGTSCDLREECELQADDKAAMIRGTRPLDRVNDPIADAEAGRVAARIVFEPSAVHRSAGGAPGRQSTSLAEWNTQSAQVEGDAGDRDSGVGPQRAS